MVFTQIKWHQNNSPERDMKYEIMLGLWRDPDFHGVLSPPSDIN